MTLRRETKGSPATQGAHAAVPTRSRVGASWVALMPVLFVLLWSTGFIGAKLGMPYAEPLTFLLLRFLLVTTVLVAAALGTGAPWPRRWREVRDLAIVGVLIHGVYLGGIFSAIANGIPAGVAALIAGMQPLLTAVFGGPYLGEHITRRQWLGFAIGLVGVALVVQNKLSFEADHLAGIATCVGAVFGITFGTLYQKRHGGGMDLRTGSVIQFAAAGGVMLVLALTLETMDVEWTGEFVFALLWLTLVLSIGAISLLYLLIRRGAAAKVASLFYLVPPVTALLAFALFDETLGPTALVGMAVAVAGVALVTKS